MEKEYILDGFSFSDEYEYKEALKEYNNINYISERLDLNDIKVAKKAYERLIESGNKDQHSENEDHGIPSHHFMGNRWGNSGNSVRLYFFGLQNHCRW